MTKPENMDAKKLFKIKNVEVRREAIRKMGTTLLMEQLPHKILDKATIYVEDKTRKVFLQSGKDRRKIEYFLIEADLGLPEKVKMLKMRNPSLKDVWHYEFVTNDCNRVVEALKFRNGTEEVPIYLS